MESFGLRVLVIEAHAFHRAIAVKTFGFLGCREVFQALDVGEGLARLQLCGRVDLVVCPLLGDPGDGMDALEFLHQVGKARLAAAVLLTRSLGPSMRRGVQQLVERLGMRYMGDLEHPLPVETLRQWLSHPVPEYPAARRPSQVWSGEEQVRVGLREGQFTAFYLPTFDLRDGRITGVDLVPHWQHPLMGVLAPEIFLAAVERCGALDELVLHMLEQGLGLYRELQAEGRRLPITLRLHGPQLLDRSLVLRIRALLRRQCFDQRQLCFELTGRSLYHITVLELENLLRLRALGCELSLAEFGSDQAGSQLLCQLPFTRIKLAERFIDGLPGEARCLAVVQNCLGLATALEQRLTVVGVRSAEQHLALLGMGCQSAQGDYLALPLDRDELLRRVRCDQRIGLPRP
ncbi:EAL domain-containing protein [Pseudomonas xanthosomatis]|uniref:EAL domain-containing response regulator n=1 Tax=Pseudomonas xanthosomatis TaxID=2842356 RepID=UPI001C3CA3EA|nr:EAL domain-containing protein [Pseudomonas xanthosomatis]QXH48260.1 EAL domain-containing protein [Pseudomonas xanthosomatis]